MDSWETYPDNYRAIEVGKICKLITAGDCVAVVGLSGAGKSNLLGFLANRVNLDPGFPTFTLVDCNRLEEDSPKAFFHLIQLSLTRSLGQAPADDHVKGGQDGLSVALEYWLGKTSRICILFDRFDVLDRPGLETQKSNLYSNLRALRDRFKYRLTFVTASRIVPDADSELAELFYAHTLWLGLLSESDGRWSIGHYFHRMGLSLTPSITTEILRLSWGYPSLLRAVCEAYSDGCPLDIGLLRSHPAVKRRVNEFWSDHPATDGIRQSGLAGQPLLQENPQDISDRGKEILDVDSASLTAKEYHLLQYLIAHASEVCEKDDLIRAVWPEDKIYSDGIRDESLAQLVRRLRKKIEPDPSNPRRIQTAAGRGYRYNQESEENK